MSCHVVSCSKLTTNWFVTKLCPFGYFTVALATSVPYHKLKESQSGSNQKYKGSLMPQLGLLKIHMQAQSTIQKKQNTKM